MRRALGIDRSPAAIAAATPPDRDRYLDLLRAAAIGAVVVGHWLVAAVWVEHGELRAAAVLDMDPATHWLTWLVQVMPVFFLVGGVVNARSWRSTRAAGGSWATWMARRGARLLRPTTALVWFWIALAAVAVSAGVDRGLLGLAARAALVPLWFLAVYVVLVALTPPLLSVHDRLGLALPGGLLVVAAGVDALTAAGVPHVGFVNYVLVWGVPTALGFAWADELLRSRGVRLGLTVGALGLLLAAVTWLGYPVSMVGLADGDGGANTPAVTLALLGCVQTGLVLTLRASATRWLRRPAVWAAVVRLNVVAMTVYLWHLTVMVLLVGGLLLTGGWWSVAPLGAAWWLTRPLWLAGLALFLLPVVALLAPVERTTPRPTRAAAPGVAAATVVTALAIAQLTLGGVLGAAAVAAAVGLTLAAQLVGAFRVGAAEVTR